MNGQPCILSVGDDSIALRKINLLLTKQGYQVLSAKSSKQALQTLRTTIPDLILLDLCMPDMDGYDLYTRLQEKSDTAYIPVIVLTVLEDEQDRAKALSIGAVDYLVKPVNVATLLDKVRSHLQTNSSWQALRTTDPKPPRTEGQGQEGPQAVPATPGGTNLLATDFTKFKAFLAKRLQLSSDQSHYLSGTLASDIYACASAINVTGAQMAQYIAGYVKLPYTAYVNPEEVRLEVLPAPFCRLNHIVAVSHPSANHAFVLSNPFNWELLDRIQRRGERGQVSSFTITEPENIVSLFRTWRSGGREYIYRSAQPVSFTNIQTQLRERYQDEQRLSDTSNEITEHSEPVILLANQLISEAHREGASDIHIEPWKHDVVVRYRIDGELQVVNRLSPRHLLRPLVARLKIMSRLDITERRLPQDGRISFMDFSPQRLNLDLRIAVTPMHFGEKVVLRLLNKEKSVMPLDQLGFSPRHLTIYRERVETPHGMILHVGPTGAGKSMSLYAVINEMQTPHMNIQTIENPIEYTLDGINQLQIRPEIGLTFRQALISYLRQDPDVILVGEIRDSETARTAVQAALSGHLLLSTLHTSDAPTTLTRLSEMGIEPYMISSSLVMICAQRLLRRLCPACKEAHQPSVVEKRLIGVDPDTPDLVVYRPKGCDDCRNLGYKGRIGTYEILVPNDTLRRAIGQPGITTDSLKRLAVEECSMTTLYWDAMQKVRDGICSLEDALTKLSKDKFDSRPDWMFEELGLQRPASRQQLSW